MAHRYFTQDIKDGTAAITGPDAAHLARVLRAKPGDAIALCNGAGTDYEAVVEEAGPQRVVLRILGSAPSRAEPTVWTQVFVGMAKGERMDYAVQKAVELGAGAITPFYSANSVVKPKNDEAKTQRYARIAHEAAKQCGRGILPEVLPPVKFEAVLKQAAGFEKALFFYENGGASLREVVTGQEKRVAVITGPEGGFTPDEAAAAQKAGCVTAGLGPRILRCETAPAAALAALMTLTGNLG